MDKGYRQIQDELWREIVTLRKMLRVVEPLRLQKTSTDMGNLILKMKTTLAEHRKALVWNKQWQPAWIKEEEAKELPWLIRKLLDTEPYWSLESIYIDAQPNAFFMLNGRERSTRKQRYAITMRVRAMWRRKVYDKLHRNGLIDRHIILSADEYRLNVKNIRLYSVMAYSLDKREKVTGWVGQSKIGEQRCALRKTREQAINAARQLGSIEISKKLNTTTGETDNG